jgi:uncharacterized SAM-binding protein YcdF (DUF218 family)
MAASLSFPPRLRQDRRMTATLILGAAVWDSGPSPTLRRRTALAASLYHAGVATHLIPCGGLGRFPPSEARAMADLLQAAGVPADRITTEDRSTTTEENIRFALPLLQRLGAAEILIVTDWYHAPRARLVARRLGLRPMSCSPGLQGARIGTQVRQALREIPAFGLYWWRVGR